MDTTHFARQLIRMARDLHARLTEPAPWELGREQYFALWINAENFKSRARMLAHDGTDPVLQTLVVAVDQLIERVPHIRCGLFRNDIQLPWSSDEQRLWHQAVLQFGWRIDTLALMAGVVDEPAAPAGDVVEDQPVQLTTAESRAYRSWLEAKHAGVDADRDTPTEDQYRHLKTHGCDSYGDQLMPVCDTWQTYVRKARRKLNGPKNTPRAGRKHGSSVVCVADV